MERFKNLKEVLAFSVLAVMLALFVGALAGCSGNPSQDAAQFEKNFQGTWKLSGMSEGDEVYGDDYIALMESLGGSCTMTFNEDKSFKFAYFGENEEGTWNAKDASTCSITIGAETMDATLADEKLTCTTDDASLTFKKQAE